MTRIAALFLIALLTACSLAPQRPAVLPESPGEIAASYSVELRKYTKVVAQLLTSQSITPEMAQQAKDALKAGNDSVRMYYAMSECKNVRAAMSRSAQSGSTELVSSAAQLLCAQFGDQPLDELAQLKLAQAALAALSQQLSTVK